MVYNAASAKNVGNFKLSAKSCRNFFCYSLVTFVGKNSNFTFANCIDCLFYAFFKIIFILHVISYFVYASAKRVKNLFSNLTSFFNKTAAAFF